MQTRHIIALSVVALILAGYLGYRHFKKTAESEQDQKKTASIMVAMARTSPTGGMTQMATALKRYEQDHGQFPGSLQDLYPEYVAYKEFIEGVGWEYERKGQHDYLLKKRFTKNNKQMFASVDKTMSPRIHISITVASTSGVSETVASKGPETGRTGQPPISEKPQPEPPLERQMHALLEKPVPTALDRPSEEGKRYIVRPIPEPFAVVDIETCTGFPVEVSKRHLVWRDTNGIMGFGNVEYPDTQRLTICADGQWVNVKRTRQEAQESEESVYAALGPRRTFFGVEIR